VALEAALDEERAHLLFKETFRLYLLRSALRLRPWDSSGYPLLKDGAVGLWEGPLRRHL
jgi:hypothetical protein